MSNEWMRNAATRYDRCIRDTLHWMLNRKPLGNGLLNTKVNPLTGDDYDHRSGLRGPDFTYGWIQGRGLEALVTFTRYYHSKDPALCAQLNAAVQSLYELLAELQARDGHVYFLYDNALQPIRQQAHETQAQQPAGSIFSYSDAFAAKGLVAATCHMDPVQSGQHLAYLLDVIAAIEDGRFQMDETQELCSANVQLEADDIGPRMILLGAAGVLHRNGLSIDTAFADRFIDDVLARYYDTATGLLLNVPGQDACNVGHAIEFCGFAFEHLRKRPADTRIALLESILACSLETGLQGPGIALSLSAANGKTLSPYYPWWPMPEAIRACALGLQLTGNPRLLALWQQADDAFFSHFWQSAKSYAYQTRTIDGPVDFVPATPDLDPGYHTGLSLLAAIHAIDVLLA